MKSLHRLTLGVATVLLVACGQTEVQDEQTGSHLEQLLAKNAAARGGEKRFESILGMRLKVQIEEPSFEVTGTYAATREGFVRVDVYAGGHRAFSEALGPDGGWQWRGGDDVTLPLSQQGEAALRRGMVSNLYALYAWPRHGYRLKLLDEQSSKDGFYTVLAEEPDGFTRTLWIDEQSFLVTRQAEFSALHPDVDSTRSRQITRVLDWLEIDGISIPVLTERVEEDSGKVIQRATVLSAELVLMGEPTPDWVRGDYFRPPDLG